jgi:hypothetical protein
VGQGGTVEDLSLGEMKDLEMSKGSRRGVGTVSFSFPFCAGTIADTFMFVMVSETDADQHQDYEYGGVYAGP